MLFTSILFVLSARCELPVDYQRIYNTVPMSARPELAALRSSGSGDLQPQSPKVTNTVRVRTFKWNLQKKTRMPEKLFILIMRW